MNSCADADEISERMLKLREKVGPEYQTFVSRTIEEQLAKAGFRLAMILNQIWPASLNHDLNQLTRKANDCSRPSSMLVWYSAMRCFTYCYRPLTGLCSPPASRAVRGAWNEPSLDQPVSQSKCIGATY